MWDIWGGCRELKTEGNKECGLYNRSLPEGSRRILFLSSFRVLVLRTIENEFAELCSLAFSTDHQNGIRRQLLVAHSLNTCHSLC